MKDKFERQIENYEARIESELRAAENFKTKQKVQIMILAAILGLLFVLIIAAII